jgi:hypothetical protein
MIAQTTSRVPRHTPDNLNQSIIDETINNILTHGASASEIDRRLKDLDKEWDIERMLEANASTLVIIGLILGAFASPWFYLISFFVGVFLLQHAIQGWCPPIRLFRRLVLCLISYVSFFGNAIHTKIENLMDSLNSKFEYPPAKVLYGGQVETRNKYE